MWRLTALAGQEQSVCEAGRAPSCFWFTENNIYQLLLTDTQGHTVCDSTYAKWSGTRTGQETLGATRGPTEIKHYNKLISKTVRPQHASHPSS